MTDSNMAAAEMARLRNAAGWSPHPLHKCTRQRLNQFCTKYSFQDGTRLHVYTNGDAAWWTESAGLQRWRGWHHCNAQGR